MARDDLRVRPPSLRLPDLVKLPRQPKGWGRTELTLKRQPSPLANQFEEREPAGDIPPQMRSQYPSMTKPEWATWWGLAVNGKEPGLDFVYQEALMGMGVGYYSTVDFMLSRDKLALEVQGTYWHYQQGADKTFHDMMRFETLAKYGITLIFLDEDKVLEDPAGQVEDALHGKDNSRLKGKF